MLRYSACIAVAVTAMISGCGVSSSSTPTREATAIDTPDRAWPIPPQSQTSTPSEQLDFKLPNGNTPGWLRNSDNLFGLIAFSPDGKSLAVTYDKDNIVFFDMTTGQQTGILKYPPSPREDSGVLNFAFSPDGALLAVLYGVYGGRLDMWNVAAGTFQSLTKNDLGSYQDVAFSPDRLRLAVGPSFDPPSGTDYQVEIWESIGDTWTRQRVLVDARPGFAFSPDGTMLVTHSGVSSMVSMDNPGPLVLWDVATGARRELIVDGFPAGLAYSPDGKTLAIGTMPEAGSTSGQAGTFLADVSTGKIRNFINSLDSLPPVVRFSADGALLVATYSSANQIILWNVQTGKQILALDVPAGGLRSFPVLSPDGRLLAAVSSEGQVVLWNMPQ